MPKRSSRHKSHSHSRSHSARRTKSQRTRKKTTGKKKLNIKFLILLLGIVGLLGAGAVGVLYRQRKHDPTAYEEKGDSLVAEGQYARAVREYERSLYHNTNNTNVLLKLADALRKTEPDSPSKAARTTMRVIGILSRVANLDSDNTEVQKELLEMLYSHAVELSHKAFFEQLLKQSEQFLQDDPDASHALKYKAIAEAELLKRDALPEEDMLEARRDLEAAIETEPDNGELVRNLSIWYSKQAERARSGAVEQNADELQMKAEEFLQNHLTKAPDDLETKLLLARTYFSQKKESKAKELAGEIETALLKGNKTDLIPQAAAFLMQVDKEPAMSANGTLTASGMLRAEKLLREALVRQPQNTEIMVHLALVLKKLDEMNESSTLLERAFKQDIVSGKRSAVMQKNLKLVAGTNLANSYLSQTEKAVNQEEKDALLRDAQKVVDELKKEITGSAATDLLEGKILMLQNKLTAAIKKFEAADKKYSGTNPEPVFLSALVLKQMAEYGAAANRLERLVRGLGDEQSLRVYRELVAIYLKVNDVTKAERTVIKMLDIAPDSLEARLLQTEILFQKHTIAEQANDTQRSRQNLQRGIELLTPMVDSDDPRAALQMSRFLHASDRTQDARRLAEKTWAEHPGNLGALRHLLQLDLALDDRETALERLESAIVDRPDNKVLKLLRKRLSGKENATESIEELLAPSPDSFRTTMNLYELYRQTGQKEKAKEALEKATELRPEDKAVLSAKFNGALQNEDWATARKLAQKAADLNVDGAKGLFWSGRLQMAQATYSRAISTLELAVKQRPLYSEGWRLLGDARRLAGNLADAEKAYQQALDIKPDNVTALLHMFATHNAKGLQKIALQDLQRAVSLVPNNPQVYGLYLDYLAQSKPAQALDLRRKLAADNPDDQGNRRAIVRLLMSLKRLQEAKGSLQELIKEDPDSFQNVLLAAQLEMQSGSFDAGGKYLQDYIDDKGEEATASEWMALARYLAQKDLSPQAITAYEEAIERESAEGMEATRELADQYFTHQFFNLATKLYEKAFQQSRDPRLWLRYVDALLNAKEFQKAEKLLGEYVAAQGYNAQSSLLECILALELDDLDRAEKAADRAVELAPENPSAYLHRARIGIKAKDERKKQRAVMDLQKALSYAPDLIVAREMLAELYLTRETPDIPAAVEQLRKVIDAQPKHANARLQLASLYRAQGDETKLATLLNASIKELPNVDIWYRMRARLSMHQKRPAEALTDLRKAFELRNSPQNFAALTTALTQTGNPEGALSMFEEESANIGKNPHLLTIKGAALYKAKQEKLAEQTVTDALVAVKADDRSVRALINELGTIIGNAAAAELLDGYAQRDASGLTAFMAGSMLLRANRPEDALRMLEKAKDQAGGDASKQSQLLHLIANANQQLQLFDEAADIYEQILAKNKDDFVALNNLSFVLAQHLNRADEAIPHAERALELAPDNPAGQANILDTLGYAQFKAGMLDKAQLTLEKSIREAPDSLHARYHMAEVLLAKGQEREARLQVRLLKQLAEEQDDKDMLAKVDRLLR
ncbi:MAG: tetratricopeptide repeat protein [Candidatus Pacebacteria bacterium]|nr:tetratricopeptide repeat protein [Candidatus Paceibacterota bacterium]